jgi:prepilin-type N-terminal cleavage/methylation domain-containing protein
VELIGYKNKGFTLIELLVVVAIIGILAAVGVVAYNGYTSAAKKKVTEANHKIIVKYAQNEIAKCMMGESKVLNYNGVNLYNCSEPPARRHLITGALEKIFNEKIKDVYEPSTAPITIGGPITCHGYKKSSGYKKITGYQGKHSLSVSMAGDYLHVETCIESSGSPLKTNVSLEQ